MLMLRLRRSTSLLAPTLGVLLDAAGLFSDSARRAWRMHPVIGEWWQRTVEALLARPFLPVQELSQAVAHVGRAFGPPVLLSPSLLRFREWAGQRHAQVASPLMPLSLMLLLWPEAGNKPHSAGGPVTVGPLPRTGPALRRPRSLHLRPQRLPVATGKTEAVGAEEAVGVCRPPMFRLRPTRMQLAKRSILQLGLQLPRKGSNGLPALKQGCDVASRSFKRSTMVDLPAELRRRALTLQGAPRKLRGTLRYALRTGLSAALDAREPAVAASGWKLFFLAPRMLLHRAAGQNSVPASELEQRCAYFRQGEWLQLLRAATGTRPAGQTGRVRALVVGDVFRRLVARALAQHFAAAFQEACLPYQFGLSTRAGTEGLYKLLHTATALDARATVLSIDAVGAFDHVSRQAMLEGLRSRPALAPLLPFARQFYGSASVYTWLDETGAEHDVTQGDGGEQGDPLMPALFSLAQHPALSEAAAGLQESEAIFAFLDDNYVVSAPERTDALHSALEDALWRHARVRLNRGKTRVWNAGGEEPAGLARLQPVGAEPVWTGAWSLPADQQGLLVLGAPLGSEAFVRRELRRKRETQDQLLARLPAVGDLQCAWLLLLFCASPRANCLLRMLPPGATEAFAREHDAAVCACLAALLSQDSLPTQALPQPTQRLVHLPLRFGGLGVR